MSKYLVGATNREFSDKGGYAFLCARIIASAINSWKHGDFDIMSWLGEEDERNLWCDYLGLDAEYLKRRLRDIEDMEGSGIVRRGYR